MVSRKLIAAVTGIGIFEIVALRAAWGPYDTAAEFFRSSRGIPNGEFTVVYPLPVSWQSGNTKAMVLFDNQQSF